MSRRKPKVVRFETKGQRKERRKHTAMLAVGAFLASVGVGAASLWIWPTDTAEAPQAEIQPAMAERVGQMRPIAQPEVQPVMVAAQTARDPDQPSLALCGEGQRVSCVVDGDTIWLRGEKIRVADIDTPEVSEPQCQSEYDLGMRATYRLRDLLNEGPWTAEPIGNRDQDDYGRSLRVLTRNGQSIGDMLVAEGLARTWTGRREPWC